MLFEFHFRACLALCALVRPRSFDREQEEEEEGRQGGERERERKETEEERRRRSMGHKGQKRRVCKYFARQDGLEEKGIHCWVSDQSSVSARTIGSERSVVVTGQLPKERTTVDREWGQEMGRFVKDNCVTVHFAAITSFQCRLLSHTVRFQWSRFKTPYSPFAYFATYYEISLRGFLPTNASSAPRRIARNVLYVISKTW